MRPANIPAAGLYGRRQEPSQPERQPPEIRECRGSRRRACSRMGQPGGVTHQLANDPVHRPIHCKLEATYNRGGPLVIPVSRGLILAHRRADEKGLDGRPSSFRVVQARKRSPRDRQNGDRVLRARKDHPTTSQRPRPARYPTGEMPRRDVPSVGGSEPLQKPRSSLVPSHSPVIYRKPTPRSILARGHRVVQSLAVPILAENPLPLPLRPFPFAASLLNRRSPPSAPDRPGTCRRSADEGPQNASRPRESAGRSAPPASPEQANWRRSRSTP